jgi:hypothetical protein
MTAYAVRRPSRIWLAETATRAAFGAERADHLGIAQRSVPSTRLKIGG